VIGKSVISDNGLELGTVRDYSFAINGWFLVALIVAVPDDQTFPGTFDLDLQRYEVDITNVVVIAADRPEQAAPNRAG
jgi:sporulation protein YlmC with PRC-barrel domain